MIEDETTMISLLSNESKLVIWLQRQAQRDADVTEVLIFNSKNATLRSYVASSNNYVFSSVFETVENQSQMEESQIKKSKLKRIEFNLEHSLTKICLIKRQPLKID